MAEIPLSSLENYLDTDATHEHTYFGNGYGPGNSSNVGTTYQTTTYDGETQKIGTYYTFQAATVGTGAALTTDGDQAPDSFCPAGWQLPIGNNQNVNKAFQKLLSSYNITNDSGGSNIGRSYPLSYPTSGYYYWNGGVLTYLNGGGIWWSNTIAQDERAYRLFIVESEIYDNGYYRMNNGSTLRCVSTY